MSTTEIKEVSTGIAVEKQSEPTIVEDLPEKVIETYRTKDLNMAAFIWSQPGANLVKLQGKSSKGIKSNTIFFVFEIPINDLAKLIFDYTNRKTLVEPLEFCTRQTSLRDLLHGGIRKVMETNDGD